jgi:hydroxymethylglutaryl-CoA lyase
LKPNASIKILETPRDAMQGLHRMVPTSEKIALINALLQVGFDILDIGSFVSAKAIPQMSDTAEVLQKIKTEESHSKLFVLVVNTQGAQKASTYDKLSYIGFPFSPSPTFLKKNINSDFERAWKTINEIQNICIKTGKHFMVYLSMAFGNPYGDPEGIELIHEWTEKLYQIGIETVNLSDITGVATSEKIAQIYAMLCRDFTQIEFGIHLHTRQNDWYNKIDAAFRNGCKIFDGVINGLGGCPMTGYELLGNLSTGKIIDWANSKNIKTQVEHKKFQIAMETANKILY